MTSEIVFADHGKQQLDKIMVLHVQRKRTEKLDLIMVASEFVYSSETRLAYLGCFDGTDRRRKNVQVKTQFVQISLIKF